MEHLPGPSTRPDYVPPIITTSSLTPEEQRKIIQAYNVAEKLYPELGVNGLLKITSFISEFPVASVCEAIKELNGAKSQELAKSMESDDNINEKQDSATLIISDEIIEL